MVPMANNSGGGGRKGGGGGKGIGRVVSSLENLTNHLNNQVALQEQERQNRMMQEQREREARERKEAEERMEKSVQDMAATAISSVREENRKFVESIRMTTPRDGQREQTDLSRVRRVATPAHPSWMDEEYEEEEDCLPTRRQTRAVGMGKGRGSASTDRKRLMDALYDDDTEVQQPKRTRGVTTEQLTVALRRRLTARMYTAIGSDLNIIFDKRNLDSDTLAALVKHLDQDEGGDRDAWAKEFRSFMKAPPNPNWDRRELILRMAYKCLADL